MPTTSIKVLESDKAQLEILQARYSTIMRRKLTLQEVFGLLVRKARIPLDELAPPFTSPTPQQLERLESHRFKGKPTSSDTIDAELYGRRED